MAKKILSALLLFFILVFSSLLVSAWQPPPSQPPQQNVPAPVNVGSQPQDKAGPLGASKLSTATLCLVGVCINQWSDLQNLIGEPLYWAKSGATVHLKILAEKLGIGTTNTQDHKLVVSGGSVLINTPVVGTPPTNPWTSGGKAPIGGTAYHATALQNNRFYIFGGWNGAYLSGELLIYDFVSARWFLGSSDTPRAGHSMVAYNNKLYVYGGFTTNEQNTGPGQYLNTLRIYDIASDTWSDGPNFGGPRAFHNAVVLGNRMYVFGGKDSANTYYQNFFAFNFLNNSWETISSLVPVPPRIWFSMSTYPATNSIYLFGGSGNDALPRADLWQYNLSSGQWTRGPDAPFGPRYGHGSAVFNNYLFIMYGSTQQDVRIYDLSQNQWIGDSYSDPFYLDSGGPREGFGNPQVYNNKIYVYGGKIGESYMQDLREIAPPLVFNPPSWSAGPPDSIGRYAHSAVVYNNKMYVFGGYPNPYDLRIFDFISNTWSAGPSDSIGRFGHSAVVYNNKMYVFGGAGPGGYRYDLRIFDFISNTWSGGTSDSIGRYAHSAVVYNNKMYVFGGYYYPSRYLNDLRIFDFISNTWSAGPPDSIGRSGHSAVVYNNKMYVFGGYGEDDYRHDLRIFDFISNTWSAGPSDSIRRALHSAVVYNNKMYVFGGYPNPYDLRIFDFGSQLTFSLKSQSSGGVVSDFGIVLANNKVYFIGGKIGNKYFRNLLSYDLVSSQWSSLSPDIAGNNAGSRAVTDGSNLYVFGGFNGSTYLNLMRKYNIASDTWEILSSDSIPRSHQAMVIADNNIYISGGFNGTYLSDLRKYNISTKTFSSVSTLPTPRSHHSMVLSGSKLYLLFGQNSTGALASVNIYNISNNQWSSGASDPAGSRYAHTTAFYNNKIYVFGGLSGSLALNDVRIYDISTDSWQSGFPDIKGRALAGAVTYNTKAYIFFGTDNQGTYYNDIRIYDLNAPLTQPKNNILVLQAQNENTFRFETSGRAFTKQGGAWISGGADLAEYYPSTEKLEPGDVVSLDLQNKGYIKKAQKGEAVLGVIAENPGFIMGYQEEISKDHYLVSMLGRTKVKVAGPIKKGDILTISSKEGLAEKATQCGFGISMEDSFLPENTIEAVIRFTCNF